MLLADYTYKLDGLGLHALDISTGKVVSWAWSSFKDGVADGTGTASTYSKSIAEGHVYTITLLVTDNLGATSSVTIEFIAAAGVIHLYQSIFGMVSVLTRGSTLDPTNLASLRTKWQTLLYEASGVTLINKYYEPAWPYIGNMLIAYLLVRDLAVNSANQLLIKQGGSGTTKKVVTGPTEAEWHDPSKIFNLLFQEKGVYELFLAQICALANSFEVHISGCKSNAPGPITVIRSGDNSYDHKYIIAPEFENKI